MSDHINNITVENFVDYEIVSSLIDLGWKPPRTEYVYMDVSQDFTPDIQIRKRGDISGEERLPAPTFLELWVTMPNMIEQEGLLYYKILDHEEVCYTSYPDQDNMFCTLFKEFEGDILLATCNLALGVFQYLSKRKQQKHPF